MPMSFSARVIENDARFKRTRNGKRDAARDVGLHKAGDDIGGRALRGNNEVHTGSAAHLGDAADALFHLFGGGHHKVGQLVDHDDNTRYRRLAEAGLVGIVALEIAHADLRE